MSQYLGDISAYALAVSQGYTGTEEEYAELMASYATVGQTAVTAAQTATTKASEAATSATTATNKATEATTAATTATTKAGEASTSASTATSAKDTAVSASQTATTKATEATTAAATATSAATTATTAKDGAVSAKTAAQTAQTGAETAAASVEASAEQIATNAEDISQLKSEFNDISDALSYSVTEDILNSLTFTSGYMSKTGVINSAPTLQYSNKIHVNAGDTLYITTSNSTNFRFVTAFSGESAVENSGAENTYTYTVPEGITDVVVTIYTSASNVEIELTHDTLIDVDGLKDDVDGLKDDVDGLKDDVDEHLLSASGYFNSTTLLYWRQTAQTIVYYKCKPNTKYTINKNETTPTFEICYIKEEPALGTTQPVYNYVTPSSGTNVEYTTGNDALYVLMLVGNYTGDVAVLKNKMSATSKQIVFVDEKARTIISYDEAYLPNHLYMIVNKDYEIYHNQICPKAENYTFKWNAGNNYSNRVRLNYSTTGKKSLQCDIYNADGTLAKQLTTTVHVVNITSDNIYLLPFGDSLTNHCVWESELMNMAENIVCVGTRSRPIKDSDNETRTVYNEGRAGFTSFNYTGGSPYADGLSDSGGDESPHNRWYDPTAEKFSAQYYFANNFPSSQTTPNVMSIFLGMNDLLTTHTVDNIVANMKTIIDDVFSYNSNMLIVLMTPHLRYMPTLNGSEHLRFLEFAKKMEELASGYANIVFLPLPIGMDSTNNYNMTTVSINTRSTLTEQTASDVTHPAYAGYWQIADYVLGAISYIVSRS